MAKKWSSFGLQYSECNILTNTWIDTVYLVLKCLIVSPSSVKGFELSPSSVKGFELGFNMWVKKYVSFVRDELYRRTDRRQD